MSTRPSVARIRFLLDRIMENLVIAILIMAGVIGVCLALAAGLLYLSVNGRWTDFE